MQVKLKWNGSSVMGIQVGKENARQFFAADLRQIHLEIEHLRICCELQPSFWRERPCICDSRLSEWLNAKNRHRPADGAEMTLTLTPVQRDLFRLRVVTESESDGNAVVLNQSQKRDPSASSGQARGRPRQGGTRSGESIPW